MKASAVLCIRCVALIAVSLFGFAGPAAAQSSNAVNTARIEVMERKIRALQARLGMKAEAPAETADQSTTSVGTGRRLVADLSAKLGGVERQMRQLNGRLEEYEFKQRQLEKALGLLSKEMALQREDMQAASRATGEAGSTALPVKPSAGAAPMNTAPPVIEAPAPVTVITLPEGDSAAQYKYAFSFIRKGDLDSGRTAMEKFVAANTGDTHIGNAKFWLGRIHLRQERYGQSAQQLFSLIEDHPNHPKRAEALVDLADVLVKLDSNGDACNALAEFRRVSETVAERLKKRAEQVGKSAACS
ncbi:MAG: hypothetical protein KUG56_08615 [Kordiimonadaceae bacterium]|nr:hypothetical protein [Kordiimonadaceae bacterium]